MSTTPADLARPYSARPLLLIGFSVLLLLTLLLTARHLYGRSATAAGVTTAVREDVRASAATIDAAFVEAQAVGDRLAADLASGALPYSAILARMQADLAALPDLNGLAITFEPFVYDPAMRLYQVYVYRTLEGEIDSLVGATYDYTRPPSDDPDAPKTAWYYDTIRSGPNWSDPFLATGAGRVLIEYARPFAHRDGGSASAGVVTSDLSLQEMRSLLARLDLGTLGYGFVIGRSGMFLDYPDRTRVSRGTIFDADSGFDAEVQAAARRALAGETVELRNVDALTERDSWYFFAPLPTSGGVLAVVVEAADLQPPAEQSLRELTAIALAAAGTLLFALALLTGVRWGDRRAAWIVALAFAGLCTLLIVLVWQLDDRLEWGDGAALTTQAAVERSLQIYRRELDPADPLFVVPTGFQLTAIQFPDATSVALSGFVWQFYADDIPEDVSRGFLLGQELGELLPVEEVERVRQNDGELVVWRISTTLQQTWDPVKFPFDERAVQLRFLPAELERNVVLVPDLSGYTLMRPSALPGVDAAVTINSWYFQRSSFSLVDATSDTNFGLRSRAERAAAPVLQFSVDARRNVLGPFIAYLLPGVVVLALIFAFLLNDMQLHASQDLVAALSYTAALFFVIALAHTALRDSVAAVGITYLEHLYILLYIVVLVVTVIAFLLVRVPGIFLSSYGLDLIPKLLFWPVCAGALLISTLAIFVYG